MTAYVWTSKERDRGVGGCGQSLGQSTGGGDLLAHASKGRTPALEVNGLTVKSRLNKMPEAQPELRALEHL